MADIKKAYNNWPQYDDDLVNKIYVDEKVKSSGGGDIEELREQVETNTQNISSAQSDIVNLNNTKLNSSVYDTFISTQYNPLVVKVDGKIESYYQSTDPSVNWVTGLEKNSHVGDIWYDTTTQKTLVYYKDTSTTPVSYHWQWQNVPIELIDSVNGKAKIYSGVIPTNYVAGDYWLIPLNCYTNTHSLVSQTGEFEVGTTIKLGQYTLIVDTVDANNKIDTYHIDIPNNSNYDISDTLTDGMIVLSVTSTANFTLPNNCYGGSICVATDSGTTYDSTDWVNRNDYIPQDKANSYALYSDLADEISDVNDFITDNVNNINQSINTNVSDLNTTINNNYTDLSTTIGNNYSELDSAIGRVDSKADDIDDKYDDLINGPTGVKVKLQELEDRIVAYIHGTGGNNLLRNAVGFRNRKYWDLVDSDSKIEQTYRTYAGKTVTVNMRYKKTGNSLAKISLGYYVDNVFNERFVILNSDADVTEWSEITFSYETSQNNPVIRFNSVFTGVQDNDAEANGASGSKLVFDNGLVVTDLMIGYGEQQPWTPYFDEVYGKTYNIDKEGFDIREASSDKNMHLDTNSIDFRDANNQVESVFSKAETKTDNIYLANSINIGNLNIVKLDDNNIIEY